MTAKTSLHPIISGNAVLPVNAEIVGVHTDSYFVYLKTQGGDMNRSVLRSFAIQLVTDNVQTEYVLGGVCGNGVYIGSVDTQNDTLAIFETTDFKILNIDAEPATAVTSLLRDIVSKRALKGDQVIMDQLDKIEDQINLRDNLLHTACVSMSDVVSLMKFIPVNYRNDSERNAMNKAKNRLETSVFLFGHYIGLSDIAHCYRMYNASPATQKSQQKIEDTEEMLVQTIVSKDLSGLLDSYIIKHGGNKQLAINALRHRVFSELRDLENAFCN